VAIVEDFLTAKKFSTINTIKFRSWLSH